MPPQMQPSLQQAADVPLRIAPQLDPPQRARRQRYLELQAVSHNLPNFPRDSRLSHRVLQAEVIAHAASVLQGENIQVGNEEGMSEKLSMLRWGCEDLLRGELQERSCEQATLSREVQLLREEILTTRRERDESEFAAQAKLSAATQEIENLRKRGKAQVAECDALRFQLGGLKLRVQCQSEALTCSRGTSGLEKDANNSEKESSVSIKAQCHANNTPEPRWTSFGASDEMAKSGFAKQPDAISAGKTSEVASCRPSSARRAQCAVLNARTAKPYDPGEPAYDAKGAVCRNE